MKRLLPALIATALVAAPSQRASAAEACVRCDNPFAIYRCQVDRPGLPANASIALICITELAKRNGHATCGVSRDTGATCGGEIVTVSPPPMRQSRRRRRPVKRQPSARRNQGRTNCRPRQGTCGCRGHCEVQARRRYAGDRRGSGQKDGNGIEEGPGECGERRRRCCQENRGND